MEKYVILNAEMRIVNIVLWDGDLSTWQPPEGCTYMLESEIDITTFTWHGAESA